MNKEEILKLVNAGYTKAEIEAMSSDQKPEKKPEEQPEKKPEEQPEKKPEKQPEVKKPEKKDEVKKPAEASPFTPEMITEFTGAINGLSEMIKKSNMITDGFKPKSALEKGEEVLASLINPPTKK